MLGVESSPSIEILDCGLQDPQSHQDYFRSLRLASAQSMGCSTPDS
jgi:hypothetical protein